MNRSARVILLDVGAGDGTAEVTVYKHIGKSKVSITGCGNKKLTCQSKEMAEAIVATLATVYELDVSGCIFAHKISESIVDAQG